MRMAYWTNYIIMKRKLNAHVYYSQLVNFNHWRSQKINWRERGGGKAPKHKKFLQF